MSLIVKVDKRHPFRPNEKYRFEGAGTRVIKIGRLRSSHIPLDDACISRMQAVLKITDECASFENIGTKCSVLLNGTPVAPSSSIPIASEDVVVMGATELRFRLKEGRGDPTPTVIESPWIAQLRRVGEATRMEIDSLIRRRRNPNPVEVVPTELPVPVPAPPMTPQPQVQLEPAHHWIPLSEIDERQPPPRVEKYDTRNLISQIQRERRKQIGGAMLAATAISAFFYLLL